MLLGPIGGAAVVAMGSAARVGARAECVIPEPAPTGAICLFLLLGAGYVWWLIEWLNWGADHNHMRVGTLIAFGPVLLGLLLGVIFGRYA